MLGKVKNTIEKYNMLSEGKQVVVALSGGADSVALTLALKKLGYEVRAVHVNHHLRNEESDRDMHFCENFCKKQGVSLETCHVDVKEYALKCGLSTETAARELRYRIFAKYENFAKVATAHTLNDSAETVLFNLARGTGIKGLCGVPPTRDYFVRPLCEITRNEIETFLSAENQPFVTDSSNLSDDYSRNKIRHNVIPELENVNENFLQNFLKAVDNLREDSDFLEKLSENAFVNAKLSQTKSYDVKGIITLDDAVKHRIFGKILRENNVEASRERILELTRICETEGKINPKKNTFFTCKKGVLKCFCKKNDDDNVAKSLTFDENTTDYEIFDRKIKLEVINIYDVNKKFTNNLLDYDKIKGTALLRGRKSGDEIRLVNRDFTSSVKKLFSSLYDEETRKTRLVLCDDEGVVFVEGKGCAERCKIDNGTKKVLVFCEK